MTELSPDIPTVASRAKRAEAAKPVERDLSHVPPDVVAELVQLLRSPERIDLDAIEVALQMMCVDAKALGFAVCEDDANYVRTLLYRDERVEMLALTWKPGQRSPVHDHGQSTCIVRIVEGLAHEHVYRSRETTKGERRFIERELKSGIVTRAPGSMTHSLGNDGDAVLVTLHVYSPPLSKR
ncbi:MAG: cysteine dioxygenase family protein [Alphaproteobacteria bacterium]|nr:cysteine dioxygenase family protein [Alphaproteobacteria bacterium]